MAQFEFPIYSLWEAVTAQLADAGIGVDTYFGRSGLSIHARPPRYVWIPTRSRDRNATPVRQTEELRSLFASQEHCQVYCFGKDFHQAWGLRNNLLKSLNDQAAADIDIENGEWMRPKEAVNQDGELYVLEFSMNVPVIDGFVPPSTMVAPEATTFIPASIEGAIQRSDEAGEDGETLTTVSTSP